MQKESLILCRSLTYAQRASIVLERRGITATVRKAPQGASDRGCAYCVKLHASRLQEAKQTLRRAQVPFGKVFLLDADGALQEVRE